jgi:hypothetical protein
MEFNDINFIILYALHLTELKDENVTNYYAKESVGNDIEVAPKSCVPDICGSPDCPPCRSPLAVAFSRPLILRPSPRSFDGYRTIGNSMSMTCAR